MFTFKFDLLVRAGSIELDPNAVTPGVIGFFAIFFVAAATVLLLIDMTRRVRRTRYRGEVREQLDAEEAEAAEGAAIKRARSAAVPPNAEIPNPQTPDAVPPGSVPPDSVSPDSPRA